MIDNSVVTLENKNDYLVIDKIEYNGSYFIYLSNVNNPDDFCVRKEIEEADKTFLIGLDNKEEADNALKLFTEKHKND